MLKNCDRCGQIVVSGSGWTNGNDTFCSERCLAEWRRENPNVHYVSPPSPWSPGVVVKTAVTGAVWVGIAILLLGYGFPFINNINHFWGKIAFLLFAAYLIVLRLWLDFSIMWLIAYTLVAGIGLGVLSWLVHIFQSV
jgi:endogenous inhibitor of DNA gyrase (YacG/DUF329 family)